MTCQLLLGNVVGKEGDRRRVVVVRNEVAGLGYSEILKVGAGSPVTAHDQVCIRVGEVLDPVYLAGLGPEVGTAFKIQSSKPKLLRLGAILRVELASVYEDGAIRSYELLDIT